MKAKNKTMSETSDDVFLRMAKKGDKAAFEKFYQRYKKQIFVYIYRFVNNYACAEELTQETFINAYTHLDTYSEKGKPLAWLYTIASNLSKNVLKRKKICSEVSLDAPLADSDGQINMLDVLESSRETPEIVIRNKELVARIQDAIDLLPVEDRQILLLCDGQGQSYQDVANILGYKPSTIGTRLFRARRKIAKKLSAIYKERRK